MAIAADLAIASVSGWRYMAASIPATLVLDGDALANLVAAAIRTQVLAAGPSGARASRSPGLICSANATRELLNP